ncbi:MAG: flagellar biosynthetic protein FliR [Desulfobacterales bacterium]|jgi:flagellar biosynthetic protein FliR
MISLHISLAQLQLFFLIFLRIGAILMTMPVFESRSIPLFLKLALAFATSIILFHLLELQPVPMSANLFSFSMDVVGEILIGVVIGFSVKLIFAGIQLAGQLAGYQMGLAIANVMDPQDNQQIPLLAQFNNLVALLIFITINAHHWFIRALTESYRMIPPMNMHLGNSVMEQIVQLAGNMFMIAIQVGAPVIAALLLTSVAFGLVARTVPQMNVFIVAMPLKIGVGFLFLGFSLPYFSVYLKKIFNGMGQTIFSLLKAMS